MALLFKLGSTEHWDQAAHTQGWGIILGG